MIIVILFGVLVGCSGDTETSTSATTTTTYDLEVPGSDPIRIIEGEPIWPKQSKFEHRAFSTFTTDKTKTNLGKPDNENDDALRLFLNNYAEIARKNKNNKQEHRLENAKLVMKKNEEPLNRLGRNPESEPKGWDLMEFQKHNHPYDDKKGWVSMEAVPWSVSKISKWESKYKATPKPWDNDYDSSETHYGETQTRPSLFHSINRPTNNFDSYYLDTKPNSRPVFTKPTTNFGHKVQVDYPNKYHVHNENCNHQSQETDDDIITDGLAPNFPQQHENNRRRGTEVYPSSHPLGGDGDWVLLSTTKGYKFPQRQRSLQINPDSIGAHRGVRLTVLPPLKNSKVNMTTSHGGLLQVESSFQTVEQARKQYTKRQKLKKKPQRIQQQQQQQQQQQKPIRRVPMNPAVTTKRNSGPDSSAVLAAVGAGMIPATMAMLVPMALGGRKKRDTNTPKIKLPHILH